MRTFPNLSERVDYIYLVFGWLVPIQTRPSHVHDLSPWVLLPRQDLRKHSLADWFQQHVANEKVLGRLLLHGWFFNTNTVRLPAWNFLAVTRSNEH
jgi:hypothetical protein